MPKKPKKNKGGRPKLWGSGVAHKILFRVNDALKAKIGAYSAHYGGVSQAETLRRIVAAMPDDPAEISATETWYGS